MAATGIRFSIEYGWRAHGVMTVPAFAHLAERLGYDGLTVADWNPFIVLAQAAAASERLLLSTSVLIAPYFNPVMLAHETASLHYHSRGRLVLGLGVGGERPNLFQAFGVPWQERGARTNETIEILRGLWSKTFFSYHGRFFQFERHSLDLGEEPTVPTLPADGASAYAESIPNRQTDLDPPYPPIWIGGRMGGVTMAPDGSIRRKSRTAALQRAARYGDGWLPYLTDPAGFRESVRQVRAFATEYGRDLDREPFTWAHNLFWSIGDDYEDALATAAEGNIFGGHKREFSARYDIVGTPEDCIRQVREYVDAGVQHVLVKLLVSGPAYIEQTERIAKEVIPYFK